MGLSLIISFVGMLILFVGVFLLSAHAARVGQTSQPESRDKTEQSGTGARAAKTTEPPITVETGLRAAAALALLVIIMAALGIVNDVQRQGWSAVKYVRPVAGNQGVDTITMQGPDISWAAAFAVSAPIVAMTLVVLGAMWAIWHIVRQD